MSIAVCLFRSIRCMFNITLDSMRYLMSKVAKTGHLLHDSGVRLCFTSFIEYLTHKAVTIASYTDIIKPYSFEIYFSKNQLLNIFLYTLFSSIT